MDVVDDDVWSLEESIFQLQFVVLMVNGLMAKMMDLHSGLCDNCKEKTDAENDLVRNSRKVASLSKKR